MTRSRFAIVCCVLLLASSTFAQSRGQRANADPISGTWTGELRQSPSRAIPITMELKFDGKRVVTGTVSGLPNPADVKAGTFDPKNGDLKLHLGKTGDGAILLMLEGTVVKGTATGRFSGDDTGEFTIARKT